MATFRRPYARVAPAAASVVVLAAATAYPVAAAAAFRRELVAVAAAACAALLVGVLARVRWLVPSSLFAAAAAYAVFLLLREGGLDPLAPLYGAALLLAAELAEWGSEPPPVREAASLRLARAGSLVLLATAGATAGAVLLVAARVAAARDDPLLEPLGVVAAVATVALVAWLGRQRQRS